MTFCVLDIDECVSVPCVFGTCSDQVDGFTCTCDQGYSGDVCQHGMNDTDNYNF